MYLSYHNYVVLWPELILYTSCSGPISVEMFFTAEKINMATLCENGRISLLSFGAGLSVLLFPSLFNILQVLEYTTLYIGIIHSIAISGVILTRFQDDDYKVSC